MDIYEWFSNFIKAVLLLKTNTDLVYINDVDTDEVWIKMLANESNIQISEVYADKPEGIAYISSNLNEKARNGKKLWSREIFKKS